MTTDNATPQLGEPMTIRQTAKLIGCSVWSVRQTLMRQGLPFVRFKSSGRLIFYRHQVVAWIVARQKNMTGGK